MTRRSPVARRGPRNPRRGPKPHWITPADPGPIEVLYPWAGREPLSTRPWTCTCNATGPDQASAEQHLRTKAKAALRRLTDLEAWAAALVSMGRRNDVTAVRLLWDTRYWRSNQRLRRSMIGGYDGYGSLSVEIDWEDIAVALRGGELEGGHSDVLVLRIAISLAGIPVEVNLADLWRLPEDDGRHIRDALLRQIDVTDDSPT